MSDASAERYPCPRCAADVTPTITAGDPFPRCPACGEVMIFAAPEELSRDDLDALRVRHITAQRRARIRAQTYLYVATAGSIAAVAECLYKAWFTGRWNLARFVLLAVALLAAWGIKFFASRAGKIALELRKPHQADPMSPPDFSTLSDGSQRVNDLEKMRADP